MKPGRKALKLEMLRSRKQALLARCNITLFISCCPFAAFLAVRLLCTVLRSSSSCRRWYILRQQHWQTTPAASISNGYNRFFMNTVEPLEWLYLRNAHDFGTNRALLALAYGMATLRARLSWKLLDALLRMIRAME